MCKPKWGFGAGFLLALFILLNGWVEQVQSQEAYPTRAIDIIYGFGPGSAGDLSTRITAAYLRKKWNVAINVINKPGGNTVPANLDLYNAKPDGYTLLGDPPGSSSVLGAAVKNLPFKVMDRTFIAMIATNSLLFVVPPTSPSKTLKDIADEAKRDPEHFTWTSQGGASTSDYIMRKFAKEIGLDISRTKPVTARSAPETTTLTAGGQVKLSLLIASAALPAIQAGLIRPVAITAAERSPTLPSVPTAAELGYPIVVLSFIGLSGPPKLPAYVVDKWNVALQEMLKDPEIVSQLKNIGSVPCYMNGREFREYVRKEAAEVDELWSGK